MKPLFALLLALLVCAASAQAGQGNGNGNGQGNGDGAQGNGNAGANAGGNGQGNVGDAGQGQGTPQPAGSVGQDNGNGQSAAAHAQQGAAADAPGNSGQDAAPAAEAPQAPAFSPASVEANGVSAEHGKAPDHAASNDLADAPVGESAPASSAADPPAVVDASDSLHVERAAAGNRLSWDAPIASAGQVQVWRLDAAGWVPIALTSSAGQAFDPDGTQSSEYRLTWSEEPLGTSALASVASSLSFAPALRDPGSSLGAWLVALMWAGVGAFATVRSNLSPRRVNDGRIADDSQLLPILAGVPGIDVIALDRVVAKGLRTVGQLRRLDADALAFWTGLPAATVRNWQETLGLMQWPGFPPGAAQRLALAGHATLAQVAAAHPAELLATLHNGTSTLVGPGLPANEQEVANWVVEARQALGLSVLERASTPASASATTASA